MRNYECKCDGVGGFFVYERRISSKAHIPILGVDSFVCCNNHRLCLFVCLFVVVTVHEETCRTVVRPSVRQSLVFSTIFGKHLLG